MHLIYLIMLVAVNESQQYYIYIGLYILLLLKGIFNNLYLIYTSQP